MGKLVLPPMTATDISLAFCNEYCKIEHSSDRVYPNVYIENFECDLLKITKAGYTYEYEIKVSRSDFFVDKKKEHKSLFPQNCKKKYDELLNGKRVNYFLYVCPYDLIKADEVPEWAGLIHVYGSFLQLVKAPSLLTKQKFDNIRLAAEKSIYYRFHQQRNKLLQKQVK